MISANEFSTQITFLSDNAADQTMAVNETPSNRLERFGAGALSDTEIVANLLATCGAVKAQVNALKTAQAILTKAGSLNGLSGWIAADFRQFPGVSDTMAARLALLTEVGRRMAAGAAEEQPILNRAELIAQYMQGVVMGLEVEKFWVLCLNRKNRLIRRVEISSGTATSALAHPREVFRSAIRESAAAIICVHNHPSGDPAPSAADLQVTRQLRAAANAVDITLLDHVVIGRVAADPAGRGFYSFKEAGLV